MALLPWFVCMSVLFLQTLCSAEEDPVVIQTKSGKVRGHLVQVSPTLQVYEFSGIPYAEPPVGNLRYRKTVAKEPWGENVVDATQLPQACPQIQLKYGTAESAKSVGVEDCLFLSIWIPKATLDKILAPQQDDITLTNVFTWIHGGSYNSGSLGSYNGSILAAYNDIIVAAMQYRIGSLGFAYFGTEEAPGNMGLWDQLEAMKWLYENIGAFGGNGSAITLAGESAGAASVSSHLLSTRSRQYFQRAILQSGAANAFWAVRTPQQAQKTTDIVLQQVLKACPQVTASSPATDKLRCLRNIPSDSICKADMVPMLQGFAIPFVPVMDGDFFQKYPSDILKAGEFYQVPLLIGANKDEGSYFLALTPEAGKLLPTVATPDRPTDLLNMTHYKALLEAPLKVLFALQPLSLQNVPSSAMQFEYWPSCSDDYPHGDAIVQAAVDSTGDYAITCATFSVAQRNSDFVTDTYAYYFTHRSELSKSPAWMGVKHGDDLAYVFGKPLGPDAADYTATDVNVTLTVMQYWANFVKYGNPNGNIEDPLPSLQNWPSFTGVEDCSQTYLEINAPNSLNPTKEGSSLCGLKTRQCLFWQMYYPKILEMAALAAANNPMASQG